MKKNTGKPPTIQFYFKDWMTDLEDYPLQIEGAWLRICNRIWHDHRRTGKITKSLDDLERIWNVPREEVRRILTVIKNQHIGGVTLRNDSVTLTCWRVQRDAKLKTQNKLRQQRYRASHRSNARVAPLSPCSSSSTSTSIYNNTNTNYHTIEEVRDTCVMVGIAESEAQGIFDYFNSQQWRWRYGAPVGNLASALRRIRNSRQARSSQGQSKTVRELLQEYEDQCSKSNVKT